MLRQNNQGAKLLLRRMSKPRSKRLKLSRSPRRKKMRSLTHLGGNSASALQMRRLRRRPKLDRSKKAFPRPLKSKFLLMLTLNNPGEECNPMSGSNSLCSMSSRRLTCKNRSKRLLRMFASKRRLRLRRNPKKSLKVGGNSALTKNRQSLLARQRPQKRRLSILKPLSRRLHSTWNPDRRL